MMLDSKQKWDSICCILLSISSSSPYKNDQTHICYTHELEEFIFIYFHIFLNIPSYHIGASSIKWSVSLVSEISRYS